MIAESEDAVRVSHLRSNLDRGFAGTDGVVSAFDVQIKISDVQQPFRLFGESGFNLLRRFDCGAVLAAFVEVSRDRRNQVCEHLIGNSEICGVADRLEEMLNAGGAVTGFQFLIAERCMCRDQ